LIIFAEPILGTIFQRGAFDWSDVEQSSLSLIGFAIGLPFFMAMKVLVPAFFSRQDTKTPMMVAGISLILNVFLNYLLAFYFDYGHLGLAVASSISAIAGVSLLSIFLSQKNLISLQGVFSSFSFKILVASIALASFLVYTNANLDFETFTQMQRLMNLLYAVLTSVIIYVGISFLLGIRVKDFR
jgi:putative peptidoglycan lipid II flippase